MGHGPRILHQHAMHLQDPFRGMAEAEVHSQAEHCRAMHPFRSCRMAVVAAAARTIHLNRHPSHLDRPLRGPTAPLVKPHHQHMHMALPSIGPPAPTSPNPCPRTHVTAGRGPPPQHSSHRIPAEADLHPPHLLLHPVPATRNQPMHSSHLHSSHVLRASPHRMLRG